MDYKELIERSRRNAQCYESSGNYTMAEYYETIASAIETLLAERDAAVEIVGLKALPNDPLTREELQEMDGEPVWIEWGGHPQAGWALVRVWSKANNVIYLTYHNGNTDLLGYVLADGGKIYRRRPEDGKQK